MAFVRVPGNDIPEGAEEHWLEGRGGVKVRVLTAPARGAPRGSVIVAPGRTEFIEKYFEVIRELQARGFAVFCIDWRGQGLSGREVDNGLKGHFVTFDDPVNDLSTALKLLADRLPRPHIGLAHSMGGAILLRALQTRRIELDAAAFTAPMWGLPGLKDFQKKYARFMVSLGLGGTFAPSVEKKWKRENFKRNPVTNDKERHSRCQGLIAEEPRLALAGPTIGWVAAAADAIEGFQVPGALAHLRIPILVATAADEQLIDNASHDDVIHNLPDATHITIAGAKHEILMERDDKRAEFWAAFDSLTERVVPAHA
ncbi:alpha/beta fold hydrolase [Terricaulis silvestris]|uniref:Lysophospholipase L2 n=1 Tax=Terricaulis silvestris TaxID=2686094 RepID=A0A6I6MP44_9CAUL|nr:alpha/beta hydrolase [Terricaulis silvestris]QGZ96479.1 lysophospholipase L2 [Terricaulis silvestris]